jgi:hypothetical protein
MCCLSAHLSAQEKTAPPTNASAAAPAPASPANDESLAQIEKRLSERYDHLELLVGRLAELSRSAQPRRAALLQQLITESRSKDVAGQFDKVVAALEKESYTPAIDGQTQLHTELQKLLDLLLQEDRDRQIESERKKIARYLQDLNKIIRLQRGVKARTDGGDDSKELSKDQSKVGDKTGQLGDEIEQNESQSKGKAADGSSGQPQAGKDQPGAEPGKDKDKQKPKDGDSSKPDKDKGKEKGDDKGGDKKNQGKENSGKPKDVQSPKSSKPSDGSPKSDDAKPQDGKPSESSPSQGEPKDGKPSQNSPSDGQPSESPGQPSDEQSPSEPNQQSPMQRAAQRLRRAQERMKQAQKQLDESKRKGAVEEQEKAVEQLEQAKAELERILRQLREEELERMLVMLEARFRKMLEEQTEVYDETKKLDAAAGKAPTHEVEIATGRLSRKESLIVREADRALVLLREDGTSIAFPEAIEQARDDMQTITDRLRDVKVDMITQGLEEDVISALEEALAAMQQALKDLRENKGKPPQGGSGGQPDDEALVNRIAELRMIRSLQARVNNRTKQYGAMIE